MLEIKKILLPTDFSDCSGQALRHAVKLAQEHKAELHLFHAIVLYEEGLFDPASTLPDASRVRQVMAELATKRMGALLKDHEIPDLVLTQVHRRGVSAAPPIAEYAREADIDLIVMGTHGRRGIRKMFLGSVTAEIMRSAPCSVLTVRGKGSRVTIHDIKNILVPVDFSVHSDMALQVATGLAEIYGSTLQLVHILGDILHPVFFNMGAIRLSDLQPEIIQKAESELKKRLEAVSGQSHPRATFHAREGHAAREIVRFSRDEESDLIVMATHGHTDVRHVLLGGTAERVITGAECPVFTVRPDGRPLRSET